MQIQLSWEDPATQEQHQQTFALPLAIGKELSRMPERLDDGQPVSHAVLLSSEISRYHALIAMSNDRLELSDRSTNGTLVNGRLVKGKSTPLANGDTIQVGPYQITVTLLWEAGATQMAESEGLDGDTTQITDSPQDYVPRTGISKPSLEEERPASRPSTPPSTILFDPETDRPTGEEVEVLPTPRVEEFPPGVFRDRQRVTVQDLHATGDPVEEIDYVALGGGMGSFAFVDHLRVYGVSADRIAVISLETKPYGRYQRLCENSQIPPYERLRSGSDSCPDNLWGWPGYAWREAWREVFSGQIGSAARHLWQVFAEPVFANTYTPQSGKVFESVDREANRIGWSRMLKYGRIRGIRKTEDGRYAIAYSIPSETKRDHRYLIARYVHLATGYPALRFLPDLQDYRRQTGDFQSVVNAYEPHNQVYERLERQGGTLIVRGRGIVASRIVQRLYEARKKNPRINIINLVRTPTPDGQKFGRAQRLVENHWEFQPYNWPKSTWGGDMRRMLEAAPPQKRYELLKDWGGTTTADRIDWRQIISTGIAEGWYKIEFGKVERVERTPEGKPLSFIRTGQGELKVEADFIIDATGLEADPRGNPLLNDLISHYNLPLNPSGRLHVANDFEMKEMRNDKGRMYAAGVITLGGPYAPVDTFLGLQYCAQRAVEALHREGAPQVGLLNPISSFAQWTKWVFNSQP